VERLNWAFEQSKRNDFAGRMIDELYRKGGVDADEAGR
jgi:hypothetical protein